MLGFARFTMNNSKQQLWERFQQYYLECPLLGLALDLSRMNFEADFFARMEPRIQKAFAAMAELERGAIANPDENRMVGHYWLRNPAIAPTQDIRREIEETISQIKAFASDVHNGVIHGAAGRFTNLLLIGIGGSALGPQFVSHALSHPQADKLRLFTFDNTDPDGMDRVLANIGRNLGATLCIVISKSGGTKETRNGMIEAKAAYERDGLVFGQHAVAITREGSELDKYAVKERWLQRFPMWDWVGGRTSELSAVGLLAAALQGFDIESMLAGAKACDEQTRLPDVNVNPAAQLALAWFHSGNGKGTKNMVVIPYKDRLELLTRYLQQLVMESIGKELDLGGNVVSQGIAVFGNKGSTDQHSYIQQLRDGIDNSIVTFIEVLRDRREVSIEVDPGVTAGDYLNGFLLGTRQALSERSRESLTITIPEVSAFSVGVLIALFERAVGFYASLVDINAYHQPGVEAGKKAASAILELKQRVLTYMEANRGVAQTPLAVATGMGAPDEIETVFKICEHLAANPHRGVIKSPGKSPFTAAYMKI
jgi:glucose-6-phosphate isomerase